jgi:hypothetical protein
MGTNYKVTAKNSASYAIDLTDTDVNPEAAPTSTPRQGGFTLRNRVNFTNVATANKTLATFTGGTAATSGYTLRFLEVPERTLVKDVQVFAVKGETVPGHSASLTSGGFHASHLASLAVGISVEQRSKPESSASYVEASHMDLQLAAQSSMAAGGQFGNIGLKAIASSLAFDASLIAAVDSSLAAPELSVLKKRQTVGSTALEGVQAYFPYGGYIVVHHTDVATGSQSDASTSKIDSDYTYLTGTWEMQADCMYIPE